MKKHQNNFNVAFPESVNSDHQMVEIIHKEIDPLGSYTGRPADGGEPVQDADDL